ATPGDFAKKTMFVNSGSEAVENAIKMARKYTGKSGIIVFERAYHGRTLLTMDLTSKVMPYKKGFGPFTNEVYRLPYPYYYRSDDRWSSNYVDEINLDNLNGFFICESSLEDIGVVITDSNDGIDGIRTPSKRFMQGLKKICED